MCYGSSNGAGMCQRLGAEADGSTLPIVVRVPGRDHPRDMHLPSHTHIHAPTPTTRQLHLRRLRCLKPRLYLAHRRTLITTYDWHPWFLPLSLPLLHRNLLQLKTANLQTTRQLICPASRRRQQGVGDKSARHQRCRYPIWYDTKLNRPCDSPRLAARGPQTMHHTHARWGSAFWLQERNTEVMFG